jgi:hypothetical protein
MLQGLLVRGIVAGFRHWVHQQSGETFVYLTITVEERSFRGLIPDFRVPASAVIGQLGVGVPVEAEVVCQSARNGAYLRGVSVTVLAPGEVK